MPELSPLPRRPVPPPFAPRRTDFDEIVARADVRRRRQVRSAAVSVLAASAVLAAASGGQDALSGLEPAPPAAGPTRAPGVPGGPAPTWPVAPGGSGHPGGSAPSATVAVSSPPVWPSPPAPPSPPPAPPAGTPTEAPPRDAARESGRYLGTGYCDGNNPAGVSVAEWCLGYSGPSEMRKGAPTSFRLSVCRPVAHGPGRLTFPTAQSVDLTIRGEERSWRWGEQRSFAAGEHVVVVEAGECEVWTLAWNGLDADKRWLPPGVYDVLPGLLAAEVDFRETYRLTITE